ncbi:lysine exporter LysO family protein [Alicyclobacillus curvatus]|nr:lysine exporter LysO family protein [Alicyclobacillus curvatus]
MWWFVLTFIGGLAVGRRNLVPTALLRRVHSLINVCLGFLIFVLGYELGANRHLVQSLPLLGYRASVIALFSMAGSVLFAMVTARWLWTESQPLSQAETPAKNHAQNLVPDHLPSQTQGDTRIQATASPIVMEEASVPRPSAILHLPLLILLMLTIGGFLGWLTAGRIPLSGLLQNAVFAIMLGGIGLEIGADPRFWRNIKRASWRMFLFPLNAVFGSLFGGLVATLLIRGPLLDNLAAAAGLGWYSLAAVLVNQLSGPESGTIAFLANVMREMLGFLAIPILNRFLWTPGAVALGAATTMDTTLPLFRRDNSGGAGVVYAFVNGVLVSALVPLLIPLVLKL